jgi:hypothetical protein
MIDFISGEKFITLSSNKIIYVPTHQVNSFFKNPPSYNFILISHNGDEKIVDYGSGHYPNVNLIPNNLKKWFGQNVCVKNERLESIPIGVENSYNPLSELKKQRINYYHSINSEKKNILYINHDISTNLNERAEPYSLFGHKDWVTIRNGRNGVNFEQYIKEIKNHKFVLCPEGNGTDTHRTWETLYVGSIPIVKKNINNSFYTDLPISFVNSWSEINEDFLNFEYNRILNSKFNLEMLNFDYWKNKILNTSIE